MLDTKSRYRTMLGAMRSWISDFRRRRQSGCWPTLTLNRSIDLAETTAHRLPSAERRRDRMLGRKYQDAFSAFIVACE
jgi:hypothetical protein